MPSRRRGTRKPLRKGAPRYVKKKMMRRGRRDRYLTPKLTRFTTGVPDRMIVRMTYEDVYNLIGPSQYQWRLNSIFDPDYTGTGHQPRGHDQWATLFASYRVFAVKARIYLNNTDDTGGQCVGLITDNVAGTYNNTYLSEIPRCKTIVLAQGDGGLNSKIVYYKANIPRILGYTSAQYKNNPNTKCAFGTSPAEVAYLTLVAQSLGNYSGAPGNLQIRMILSFYVELMDRVELSAS